MAQQAATDPNEVVTYIITNEVAEGRVLEYEAWKRKVDEVCRKLPGHLGVQIIRPAPGSRKYTTIVRFDSHANLQRWIDSAERKQLLLELAPLIIASKTSVQAGIDFWFCTWDTQPKVWKQYLLILSVIMPLAWLVPHALAQLAPYIGYYNEAVYYVVGSLIITYLMTYHLVPRLSRLLSRWLYR